MMRRVASLLLSSVMRAMMRRELSFSEVMNGLMSERHLPGLLAALLDIPDRNVISALFFTFSQNGENSLLFPLPNPGTGPPKPHLFIKTVRNGAERTTTRE